MTTSATGARPARMAVDDDAAAAEQARGVVALMRLDFYQTDLEQQKRVMVDLAHYQ